MKSYLLRFSICLLAALALGSLHAAPSLSKESGMVELKGSDVALEMDGLRMSRDEVLIYLQQIHAIPEEDKRFTEFAQRLNGLNAQQQRAVCISLYQLVRQQLLLRAAKDAQITVTDEDRRTYAQNWSELHPGEDFTEMLGKLKDSSTTPLALSRNDVFLIYKWSEQRLSTIVPSEKQVQQILANFQQIAATFGQQSAQEQKQFAELATRPEMQTDEGFAALAREYSDGEEAEQGGLFPELMTRSEIAAANFDQPFTTPVGETSPLIETPTVLRYIRVLKEFPASMPGEPPKLQVAQIIYGKRVLDSLPTEEQLRQDIKYQLQQQYLHALLVNELAPKFHFQCNLIPKLLELGNPQKADEERVAELSAMDELSEDDDDDESEEEDGEGIRFDNL